MMNSDDEDVAKSAAKIILMYSRQDPGTLKDAVFNIQLNEFEYSEQYRELLGAYAMLRLRNEVPTVDRLVNYFKVSGCQIRKIYFVNTVIYDGVSV